MSDLVTEEPERIFFGQDGSATVLLAEPINVYGEAVTKLVFRRPNAKDIRLCGSAMQINGDGRTTFDMGVIFKYAERLGDVPLSSLDTLDSGDVMPMQMAILSFFTPKASRSTSSTDTTTSPGPGNVTPSPSSVSTLPTSLPSNVKRSA